MEKYKLARLKAGGYIATYQRSPISGTFSSNSKEVVDWIDKAKIELEIRIIEKKAYNKLSNLPANTTRDDIEAIQEDLKGWLDKVNPKLLIDIGMLIDKVKKLTAYSGDVQEIIIANVFIDMYNNNAITVDKAKIVYSKED